MNSNALKMLDLDNLTYEIVDSKKNIEESINDNISDVVIDTPPKI